MKCPQCQTAIPEDRSSCPSCGTALGDSFTPTRLLHSEEPGAVKGKGSHAQRKSSFGSSRSAPSFDSIDNARFTPGTTLAGRYRIVSLLGRGGMGEVYRADDLKLGQPVALKFLPETLSTDGATLARFHREVRVARQVSHRNVCRVYDIGEIDGQHFLSMEFIKGEELASLLRRIGRLPADKAVEIARQLCAGLAAAHDNNVLHRDLKPANVMIDSDGNVRVTDFGLAGLTEEIRSEEVRAGTPAYMAPEQLAGEEVSFKSDIYSLGLVLYEVFTGKRAFEAGTLDELLNLRRSNTTPTTPSSIVKEIDPLVERVILRCLEKDPKDRPASALQVAAALPGGDPLQAALAAGETPSPEMVAAAPKKGSLRPVVATLLLASVIFGLAFLVWASDRLLIHRLTPLEKPPEVLTFRAREIIQNLGYTSQPVDSAQDFALEEDFYRYVSNNDPSPHRWDNLKSGRPSLIFFWYRQSPRYLIPHEGIMVDSRDPPQFESGMVNVHLNTRGQLMKLEVEPTQVDAVQATVIEPDWKALFKDAGLDPASFTEAQSEWLPPTYADVRRAWTGRVPEQPQIPLRIEAAAYRGKPVYFELIFPWSSPSRMVPYQLSPGFRRFLILVAIVFVSVVIAGVWLAMRNLKLGRGDRKGAFKISAFVFVTSMVGWLFGASHVPTLEGEMTILYNGLGMSLIRAALIWVFYLALEPYVRRRAPHRIVSWNRLLAGGVRDPLVGRDILIGAAVGVWLVGIAVLRELTLRWLGWPHDIATIQPASLQGISGIIYLCLGFQAPSSVFQSLGFTFLLILLTMALRKEWLGTLALWALIAAAFILISNASPVGMLFIGCTAALVTLVVQRFGLLAMIVTIFCLFTSEFYPYTTDFSAWYIGSAVFSLVVCVALALYGFYISLAGQPLFRGRLLEE
jgi:Protein kinase domain